MHILNLSNELRNLEWTKRLNFHVNFAEDKLSNAKSLYLIYHLLFFFPENMMDRLINTAWRPGFAVIRPLINDIVSTAFTKIFNDVFNDLDVNQIIR